MTSTAAALEKFAKGESKFKRALFKQLSKIDTKKVFKRLDKMANKSRNDSDNRVRTLLFPATGTLYRKNSIKTRYGMPKKWFTELERYQFEDTRLWGTKDYDGILEYIYDDYMKLPPEDKRDPHSPVSEYSF